MKKENKSNYFFFYGLLAPAYILLIRGTSFIVHLTIIGIFVLIIKGCLGKGLRIKKTQIDKLYIFFYCSSFMSLLCSRVYTDLPEWKWQALVFFIYYTILAVFYFLASSAKKDIITAFIKGLKYGALVQVIYGYLQFFLYTFFSLDINDLIFNKSMHLVEKASHYNYGVLVPTGFSWHPGTLAPLLVIGYCLYYNNLLVKFLIIGLAFLSQSSTCVIGIIAVLTLDFSFRLIDRRKLNKKSSRKTILTAGITIVAILIIISQTSLMDTISNEFSRLISRFANRSVASTSDLSTFYHMRYYSGLPEIASKSNIFQMLFGVGSGCSGYPFVKVFGQYIYAQPWDVEAQIVADIVNYGIVGFTILYAWIIRIIIKGYRIDRRYSLCMVAILAESFTYNVRFMWVLVFFMFLNMSVNKKQNIWDMVTDNITDTGLVRTNANMHITRG